MKLIKLYTLHLNNTNRYKTLFICRLGNSLECILTNDKDTISLANAKENNLASDYPDRGKYLYGESVRDFLHSEKKSITVKIEKGKTLDFVCIPKPLFWPIRQGIINLIDK